MPGYLSGPRLNFSGSFRADPSTINNNDPVSSDHNDARNFQLATELSTEEFADIVLKPDADGNLPRRAGWNPYGTGVWSFDNCKVMDFRYADGSHDPNDSVMHLSVSPSNRKTDGKIVDIDPANQMTSAIWGFQIRLSDSNNQDIFAGDFHPAAFHNVFFQRMRNRQTGVSGAENAGAYYHSIIKNITWNDQRITDSRFLTELKSEFDKTQLLSIRFSTDGYYGYGKDRQDPRFSTGRVVGVISGHTEGNPWSFGIGRALTVTYQPRGSEDRQIATSPSFAEIENLDENDFLLHIDLSSSLQVQEWRGNFADYGELHLALINNDSSVQRLGIPIPYREDKWLERTAGIFTISLTSEQVNALQNRPLAVVNADGHPILQEEANGLFVKAEEHIYRLNDGDRKEVKLVATRFGKPLPDMPVTVSLTRERVEHRVNGLTIENAGDLKTNAKGEAIFNIVGTDTEQDPSTRPAARRHVDGELFSVFYSVREGDTIVPRGSMVNRFPNSSDILSVLVWDPYQETTSPTWQEHIRPIFHQYGNLYPVMRRILDLSDYRNVTQHLESLKLAFSASVEDPHYMPVTRDLSAAKQRTILHWLDNPVFSKPLETQRERIITLENLKEALQFAIAFEHSTIPVYLCALYSIKPGTNLEITRILRSIVMEEMLHMTLACNILNAIGGSPVLNEIDFVPNYPGELPYDILKGLEITLGPCTKERIRNLFMRIEQPNEIADIQMPEGVDPIDTTEDAEAFTIGEFYAGIKEALQELSDKDPNLFSGDPKRQISIWPHSNDNISVVDLKTAIMALDKIVEQGEGVSLTNVLNEGDDPAHYYRFLEIYAGKLLRVTAAGIGYEFSDESIAFDPEGIYPMRIGTSNDDLPEDSPGKHLLNQFNEMYARLLNSLQEVFNGLPQNIIHALGIMRNLQLTAQDLMQYPDPRNTGNENFTLGPNFHCQPYLQSAPTPSAPPAPPAPGPTSPISPRIRAGMAIFEPSGTATAEDTSRRGRSLLAARTLGLFGTRATGNQPQASSSNSTGRRAQPKLGQEVIIERLVTSDINPVDGMPASPQGSDEHGQPPKIERFSMMKRP